MFHLFMLLYTYRYKGANSTDLFYDPMTLEKTKKKKLYSDSLCERVYSSTSVIGSSAGSPAPGARVGSVVPCSPSRVILRRLFCFSARFSAELRSLFFDFLLLVPKVDSAFSWELSPAPPPPGDFSSEFLRLLPRDPAERDPRRPNFLDEPDAFEELLPTCCKASLSKSS